VSAPFFAIFVSLFCCHFFLFFSLFARARPKLQSPSEPDWCFSFYRWLTKKNKKQKQTNVESICNNQTADFQGNVSPKKRLSLFASQSSFLMNVSSITIDFDDEGLPCDQITLDPFNDQSVRSADGGNGVDPSFVSFFCLFFFYIFGACRALGVGWLFFFDEGFDWLISLVIRSESKAKR